MKKQRVLYFDLLNIAACFAVICIHHNGLAHTYAANRVWKECLLAEVGCYWAVPVFLMLSGANLMNYREKYSTKTFFKKRKPLRHSTADSSLFLSLCYFFAIVFAFCFVRSGILIYSASRDSLISIAFSSSSILHATMSSAPRSLQSVII